MTQTPDDILLPYQKAWMDDRSDVKVWEKSRRIGASYVEALDSVIQAAKSRPAGGQNTYYVSYNKEMTKQFVKDCAFWAKMIGAAASELEEVVLDDGDKDITVYRIQFASGYEIWGMPSESRNLRSKQGRAVIDEAAFVDDLADLLKAAMAFLMWGGQVRILSTHNGDDNEFNDLLKQIKDGKLGYSLHHITIDDALRAGLFERICLVRGLEWSTAAESKWREELFAFYGDDADEELLCIPKRSGQRYFSRALIDSIVDDSIPVIRLEKDDSFTWEKQTRRERTIKRWFDSEVRPILEALSRMVYMGEDFGRSGDLTSLWFLEEQQNGDLMTVLEIEMRNIPFDQQRQTVFLCLETLPVFGAAAFDSRGNGQMIAELVAQEWPGYVHQVMLSRGWYQENFPKLKSRIEDRETSVPADPFVRDDFRTIGLKQGVPQVLERTGDSKAKRHGDAAIAMCLAVFAANEDGVGGHHPYEYHGVETINPYRMQERNPWDD